MSVGFYINPENKSELENYLKDHNYQCKFLPSTKIISTIFPIRNMLSYFLLSFPWRRMGKWIIENGGLLFKTVGIEVYEGKNMEIQFTLENVDQFYLTDKPKPEYK